MCRASHPRQRGGMAPVALVDASVTTVGVLEAVARRTDALSMSKSSGGGVRHSGDPWE